MQPRVRRAAWCWRSIVVVLPLLLLGCAGEPGSGAGLRPVTGGTPAPPNSLPALPLDVPGHSAAVIQSNTILGKDAIDMSPGALVQGNNLVLFTTQSTPPSFEWGVWRYTPDAGLNEVAQEVLFNINVTQGSSAWLAVANYSEGAWQINGPYGTGGSGPSKEFDLELADYLSPGGNIYFLAAAYNGTTCSVSSLEVTSDADPPPTFSISGRVVNTDTTQGIEGVTITLNPGGVTDVTDSNGEYSFDNLPDDPLTFYDIPAPTINGFTVMPDTGYFGIQVGPDSEGNNFGATPDAPPGVTYTNTMKALFDQATNPNGSCTECHGPTQQDGGRRFDTYAHASANAAIGLAEVKSGDMPRLKPDWSAADQAKFQEWVDNGTPE